MEVLSQALWELMVRLAEKDMIDVGHDREDYLDDQRRNWVRQLTTKIREAAEKCGMEVEELALKVDREALLLKATGIPERSQPLPGGILQEFGLSIGMNLSRVLACERKIIGRRLWIVSNYFGDE